MDVEKARKIEVNNDKLLSGTTGTDELEFYGEGRPLTSSSWGQRGYQGVTGDPGLRSRGQRCDHSGLSQGGVKRSQLSLGAGEKAIRQDLGTGLGTAF